MGSSFRLPLKIQTYAALVLALISVDSATAGKQVSVGARVPVAQRVSIDQVDSAPWDVLLKRYVDDRGNVNYAAWKKSPADIARLDAYLRHLSSADPTAKASRAARLAFWINAYNAVTARGILREYPTASIRNHTAKFFGYNIWDDLLLAVGGRSYSLNQIEHEVLRKMNEPRIHFAIVCASRGCPRLLAEAYSPDRIEIQLTANTNDFFARAQNFQYDRTKEVFRLSSILKWFGEDFGRDQATRLQRIADHLPSDEARQAARANTVSIKFLDYDWKLNDQATAGK